MPQEWKTLARQVRARRSELGLNQGDLGGRGGPSRETVRQIEVGERDNYREQTFGQLDHALEWVAGTAAAIRDGEAGTDPEVWKSDAHVHSARARGSASTGGGASLVSGSQVGLGALNPAASRALQEAAAPALESVQQAAREALRPSIERVQEATRQTIEVGGRPRQTRAGNPTVTQRPRAVRRRVVDGAGQVWEFRRAIGRDTELVGTLPPRYFPLVAALSALDELIPGQQTDTEEGEAMLADLVAARDALLVAVSTVADTVELEVSPDLDWHVTPGNDGWQVTRRTAGRAAAVAPTRDQAIDLARDIAARNGTGGVVIHDMDGSVSAD